jgi:shikimate dehydrogenase
MKRYGLIGYPLTHSLSQQYFTQKFIDQGIEDCVYERFSIPSIGDLHDILKTHPDLCGFNITIPYKKEVLAFLTERSKAVEEVGACNCVKIIDGNLIGYNTDVIGFENSLIPFLKPTHNKALVLGTGGAALAIVYVLQKLGIHFSYVSRTATSEQFAYNDLDASVMASHTLIINTTPLGMFPNIEACPAIPYDLLTPEHHLFDLTYNPAVSTFLAKGMQMGATIQNGQQMFVEQAEQSWRIWNS